MSLPALQNDSNVPSSKLTAGNAYWLNHVLVHTDGVSNGTGDGQWSYDSGATHRIKYDSSTNKWVDLTDGQPSKVSDTYNVNTTTVANSSTAANPAEVFLWNNNGGQFLGKFANPFYTVTGPTVTSHYWVTLTSNAKIITSDTVQSSDLTFLKGTNSYTPPPFSLVAISGGYVYDYQYNGTDLYTATIDSQPVSNFFLDTSWTASPQSYTGRTPNSHRILNVLGTIPSTTNFNLSTSIWNFTARTFENNSRNMFFRLYKTGSNASPTTDLHVYFYVYGDNNDIKAKFAGFTYEGNVLTGADKSGTEFTVGAQATMTHTFTVDGTNQIIDVPDWVYSAEPEGDGYVAPVTTTSNGGGKPDRYPLIMTNLFNRNRSLYSIGMTHKDENLFL